MCLAPARPITLRHVTENIHVSAAVAKTEPYNLLGHLLVSQLSVY